MTAGEAVTPARSLRALAGLLASYAAALSANRVLAIALPWFVLTTTGSIARTGLIAFCQIGPYVVVQALSGPLIDRLGPKRISIAGDLVSTVAMAVTPLLYLSGALSFGVLLTMVAIVGAADGPANGAKGLFVPQATRTARVPIERGTGLTGAVERMATTIGPAIAGVVVGSFGSVYALWITACLFALSALIVSATLANPETDLTAPVTDGYGARLRAGAAFLRRAGLLRAVIGMGAATNLLDQAFMSVLLPVWARASGHGPEVIGLVISVFSAASIVASLTVGGLAERLPRRPVYLIGYLIGGVPRFVVLAIGVPLWAVLAVFAVGGLGSGFINPIIGAVMFDLIPPDLLARVKTLAQAVAWAGIPFGGLVGAGLVTAAGLTGTLWIVGACYLIAIVVPGLRGNWSGIGAPRSAVIPSQPHAPGCQTETSARPSPESFDATAAPRPDMSRSSALTGPRTSGPEPNSNATSSATSRTPEKRRFT
jgi:MFS family permease